jgi:hypothetical protein
MFMPLNGDAGGDHELQRALFSMKTQGPRPDPVSQRHPWQVFRFDWGRCLGQKGLLFYLDIKIYIIYLDVKVKYR